MPDTGAAIALLAAASIAHAQVDQPPLGETLEPTVDELAEERPSLPFWLETKARFIHQFDTNLDGGGDFNLGRANAKARFLVPFSRRLIVDTDIGYEYSNYRFSGTGTGLAGLDPWHDVSNLHIRPLVVGVINEDLTLLGAPIFDWFGEHGAGFGDTFTLGALGAVRYRWNDNLALGIGVQVNDRLEDDPIVFPVFILNYQATEDLLVRTNDFNLGAAGGTGIEALYSFADEWRIGAGFQVQLREFRLDDEGPAPGGVGRELTVPIYARLDYLPTEKVIITLFAGTFVAGNMQLMDANGIEITEEDYDPGFGIGLQVQARF